MLCQLLGGIRIVFGIKDYLFNAQIENYVIQQTVIVPPVLKVM